MQENPYNHPMPEAKRTLVEPIVMLVASIVVAFLAARGQFTSVMGFPYVFGGVILLFGSLSLRKQRNVALVPRIAIVALAAAVPFGGGVAQGRLVERQRAAAELAAITVLVDTPAAPLAGLRPVNPDTASPAETLFDGKVTIITFWTTWCSPCRRELSELQTLYQENRDVGLQVVAVTRSKSDDADPDTDIEKARRFVEKYALTFPVGFDESGTVHTDYRVPGVPRTVLIDQRGRIVGYGVGLPGGRKLMEQARTLLLEHRD